LLRKGTSGNRLGREQYKITLLENGTTGTLFEGPWAEFGHLILFPQSLNNGIQSRLHFFTKGILFLPDSKSRQEPEQKEKDNQQADYQEKNFHETDALHLDYLLSADNKRWRLKADAKLHQSMNGCTTNRNPPLDKAGYQW
jgi:hypothetical protein